MKLGFRKILLGVHPLSQRMLNVHVNLEGKDLKESHGKYSPFCFLPISVLALDQ
jgi:hypothetical protein